MRIRKRLSAFLLVFAMLLSSAVFAANGNAPVRRGEALQALYEREGAPMVIQSVAFPDAAGTTYADAAVWAKGAGVVNGDENGLLRGEAAVTREQLAVMLYRYAKHLGMDVSTIKNSHVLVHSDMSGWAVSALQWAVGNGILSERADGRLDAWGSVAPAELTRALERLDALRSPLSLWTDGTATKNALVSYMEAITDESSADYIPVEDRIAVFDFDGTLFCETDPNYFDYTLLKYRVLEDPAYKDKASDFEKEVANKIKEQNETGKSFSGLEIDHGRAVASAFAGMTVAEFNAYIQEFKKQPMPSYTGMLRGDGWYLPMLEIVDFLQANDFTVYIISGTDRLIVRGIVAGSPMRIPNRQIIGSDETIVASGQGDKDGLSYVYKEDDKLVLGGEFLIKNLKMNKVSVIMQEIGQQPVLSFGNSTGDSSMAEYVASNNPYKSLAFMLCCDDLVRENGNESKAQKMFDLCEQYHWIPVSMKNDWTTIYGPNVTYLGAKKAA